MLFPGALPLPVPKPQPHGRARCVPPTDARPSAQPLCDHAIIPQRPDEPIGVPPAAGLLHLTSHLRFGQPHSYSHQGITSQLANVRFPSDRLDDQRNPLESILLLHIVTRPYTNKPGAIVGESFLRISLG